MLYFQAKRSLGDLWCCIFFSMMISMSMAICVCDAVFSYAGEHGSILVFSVSCNYIGTRPPRVCLCSMVDFQAKSYIVVWW